MLTSKKDAKCNRIIEVPKFFLPLKLMKTCEK